MATLKALLLMLSSDQDGEIVNAARAIGRKLRSEGRDWHALVDELSGVRPTAQHRWDEEWDEFANEWKPQAQHNKIAAYLLKEMGHLFSPKERAFLNDMQWLDRPMTPKQAKWLRALTRKGRR